MTIIWIRRRPRTSTTSRCALYFTPVTAWKSPNSMSRSISEPSRLSTARVVSDALSVSTHQKFMRTRVLGAAIVPIRTSLGMNSFGFSGPGTSTRSGTGQWLRDSRTIGHGAEANPFNTNAFIIVNDNGQQTPVLISLLSLCGCWSEGTTCGVCSRGRSGPG